MKILQILVLALGLTVFVNAQEATLTGSVYDAYGAVILKSKITALNQKGEKFETFVNDDGIYNLVLPYNVYKPTYDFKIAKYDITVEAGLPGFEKITIKDFKIVSKDKFQMNLDFALDIAVKPIIDFDVSMKYKKQNKFIKRKINKQ